MAIYFGNLDRQLADRQDVIKEDAARQYRGSRDTMRAFSGLGDTVSEEIRRYDGRKREDALMEYKVKRQRDHDDVQRDRDAMNIQQHNSQQLDHKLKNIMVLQKMAEGEHSSRYWKNRDKVLIKGAWDSASKLMSDDVQTIDPAERIIKYGSLYGTDAVAAVEKYMALKKDFDDNKGLFFTDDAKKKEVDDAYARLATFSPLSFGAYTIDQDLVDTSVLKINPRAHSNSLMRAALRDANYIVPDPDKIYKEALNISDNGNEFQGGASEKSILNQLKTISSSDKKTISTTTKNNSGLDKWITKAIAFDGNPLDYLRAANVSDKVIEQYLKDNPNSDLAKSNSTKAYTGQQEDWKDKYIIDELIKREGYGTNDKGHAYYDGKNPSLDGEYSEDGGDSLVLAGGLNVYDWMDGKPTTEKKALADRLFKNDPDKHSSFMKYLTMDSKHHKTYFNDFDKRGDLKITRDQQRMLTREMNNDFLSTLIRNHSYLKDFSNFPTHLQLFLADTSFNMGPNWLKDFSKFEKELKGWVEDGQKPERVSGMIREFKDSEHYRKTKDYPRTQDNVSRLVILGTK